MQWKMHDVNTHEKVREIKSIEGADAAVLVCQFQLLDDDDNVLFEGLCENLKNQDGDSAFEPLDWAEADSGCTQMEFRYSNSDPWEAL